MGYNDGGLGNLRPHRHPGERRQAGMILPGDMLQAARRRLGRRLKWFREKSEDHENQYSVDVRPGIEWGLIHEDDPENQISYDVRPGIFWGLIHENTPEDKYSYDVRPGILFNWRHTDTRENKMSYDVRPGIEWALKFTCGFNATANMPDVADNVRDTFGSIAIGDYLLDEQPPNVWSMHGGQVTSVETSGSYCHVETDDAGLYKHVVLWEFVKTISLPAPSSGSLWRGGYFASEASADAFYHAHV